MFHFLKGDIVVSQKMFSKYKTIQEALDASPVGATIYIEEGVYHEALTLTKDVRLVGRGAVTITTDSGSTISIKSGHIQLEELFIHHTDSSQNFDAVVIYTPEHHHLSVHMKHVTIQSVYHSGLYCNHGEYEVNLEQCLIEQCRHNGVGIGNGANPTFHQCVIRANQSIGVFVFNGGKGTFTNCTIEQSTYNVLIETKANPQFHHCLLQQASQHNALIQSEGGGYFKECQLTTSQNSSVISITGGHPLLEQTTISHSAANGVWVTDEAQAELQDCHVHHNAFAQIATGGQNSFITLSRCHIYEGQAEGIYVHTGAQLEGMDSFIYQHPHSNVFVDEDATLLLERCEVYESESHGIFSNNRSKGTIRNSTFFNHISPNIALSGQSDFHFEGCTFTNEHQLAFWVREQAKASLTNCTFSAQSDYLQIFAEDEATVTIEACDIQGNGEYIIEAIKQSVVHYDEGTTFNGYETDSVYIDETSELFRPTVASQEQIKPTLSLHDFIGLKSLKEQVQQFIHTVQFHQMRQRNGFETTPLVLHSLFLGNPGTGKTSIARVIAQTLHEHGVLPSTKLIEVSRQDLVGEFIGQTALKTEEVLQRAKGGILFIDEAYTLYSTQGNDFGKEAIETILKFMEDHRDDFMIIFAGYEQDMQQFLSVNAGLRSRIPNTFYFDDYTPEEIVQIGLLDLTRQAYTVDTATYAHVVQTEYARSIDKSNARWVRNFNQTLIMTMANRVIETNDVDVQTITREDLYTMTEQHSDDPQMKIEEITAALHALTGLQNVKQFVDTLRKEAQINTQLHAQGMEFETGTYHMSFIGNPGTGKTTVAHLIASLFHAIGILPTRQVISVNRSDLVGSHVGHTEQLTEAIIQQAMGGVLFIDEAYQLAQGGEHDFGRQAIETLLTALENYRDQWIVILAGYTKEMHDFFDTNPGLRSRVPYEIEFPDYTPEEVASIVIQQLQAQWTFDETIMQEAVETYYATLPTSLRANGRTARNMSENIIRQHKVWLVDTNATPDQFHIIHPTVIRQATEHRS